MFGGYTDTPAYTYLADTWEWDGTTWTKRSPATSPPGRNNHALAYDSARGKTVLFGGSDASTSFADTWEWDGTNWTLRSSGGPSGRETALVFDSARGQTILFGGQGASNATLGGTWKWSGSTWTQQYPATDPEARARHALAFDAVRSRTVLFGGTTCNGLSCYSAETWEWDGTYWAHRSSSAGPGPAARVLLSMASDPSRGRTILFGGSSNTNASFADTWEWDGASWTQRMPTPSPSARSWAALAFDSARRKAVLFGGSGVGGLLADTWEYAVGACR